MPPSPILWRNGDEFIFFIAGRDVSLTSVSGDITNERTVSTYANTLDGYLYRNDVVDREKRGRIYFLLDITHLTRVYSRW